jgi:hypothetical protein
VDKSRETLKSKKGLESLLEKICQDIQYKNVAKLKAQLKNNKTFMNMAIHDMRNPTNAIAFAVNETL